MFKNILAILGNRAKVGLVEYVMQIVISALHEYQRSSQSGDFDVKRQNQEKQAFDNSATFDNQLPTINNTSSWSDFLKK